MAQFRYVLFRIFPRLELNKDHKARFPNHRFFAYPDCRIQHMSPMPRPSHFRCGRREPGKHHHVGEPGRNKFRRLEIKEPGKAAHSFRRFRASVLGIKFVDNDLRKFWLGHENNDITAECAEQMFEMNEWR
jgi:hypothetical protein